MAVLSSTTQADFSFLRGHLEVSDSDLSKQMGALEKAGYVQVSKSGHGRGSQTTYSLTLIGDRAYHNHRRALTELLAERPG